MRIFKCLAISLALLAPAAALAQQTIPESQFSQRFGQEVLAEVPCVVPYTFVNGTVAQAGQVNANFSTLAGCLNSIYASDIMPTSLAQATFGGSLQYTFPAGVAVAGGPNNPFTTSSGSVWLTSSGSVNGPYAVNFGTQNCGNTGLLQIQNNGTAEDTVDCNGNLTNKAGSTFGNNIAANNGNFTSPASTAIALCPGGCGSGPNFNFLVNGNANTPGTITATGPVYGAPSGSGYNTATPAPYSACYQATGAACGNGFHTIWGFWNASITGTCATGTVCTIGSGGTTSLTGNAAYTQPDGGWDVSCATFAAAGVYATAGVISQVTVSLFSLLNETGGNLSGSTHVGFVCQGI